MMKKPGLILLFITAAFLTNAQEIVDNQKLWSILTGHCYPDYTTYSTAFYKFDQDTIIEGNLYQQVFISEDEFHEEWFFYGYFIREENKKVYLREYFGEEGLIYDFNLQLGDTVVVNNPRAASEVTLVLTEIDSVETFDGYRERWKLTNDEFMIPEYWIEGIGSMGGVLNSTIDVFGGLCGTYILLCEEENGFTVYLNPEYEYCYYLILDDGNEIEAHEDSFKMIYKPSEQKLELVFESQGKRSVWITDLLGREVINYQAPGSRFNIPFYNKKKGLYIVNVSENNGKPMSKKLIIY